MTNSKVAVIALALVPVAAVAIAAAMYVSARSQAAGFEEKIKTVQAAQKNVVSDVADKAGKLGKFPPNVSAELSRIAKETAENKYGPAGGVAQLTFLQKQNPEVTDAVLVALGKTVADGRDQVKKNMATLDQTCVAYKGALESVPTGKFMKWAGYPVADLAFCAILHAAAESQAHPVAVVASAPSAPSKP